MRPASDLALAREASSRAASPARVVTKRVRLGCFSPATMARARLSWASRVRLSRTARFSE